MKVDVFGEKWSVKFKKMVKDTDGTPVAGLCDHFKKELHIATSYPEEMPERLIAYEISQTFYHELAHAIFYEYGMRDQSYWNPDVEHMVISGLETVLAKNLPINIDFK